MSSDMDVFKSTVVSESVIERQLTAKHEASKKEVNDWIAANPCIFPRCETEGGSCICWRSVSMPGQTEDQTRERLKAIDY